MPHHGTAYTPSQIITVALWVAGGVLVTLATLGVLGLEIAGLGLLLYMIGNTTALARRTSTLLARYGQSELLREAVRVRAVRD